MAKLRPFILLGISSTLVVGLVSPAYALDSTDSGLSTALERLNKCPEYAEHEQEFELLQEASGAVISGASILAGNFKPFSSFGQNGELDREKLIWKESIVVQHTLIPSIAVRTEFRIRFDRGQLVLSAKDEQTNSDKELATFPISPISREQIYKIVNSYLQPKLAESVDKYLKDHPCH